jgi:ABC-type cobalamin/Fe3+-siderophores transport system ATPase subunit
MAGLKYYKLDLHTHTPASKCYLHKDHTPEQIVQAALDKGLSAIAITDHNTVEWIDRVKVAAQEKGLVVFPGIEISLHEGYHLIALFDPKASQNDLVGFLGTLKIPTKEQGLSETLCKVGVYDVIKSIHENNGLAILAHIDAPKGAFFELSSTDDTNGKVKVPVNCSDVFNDPNYDAVECVNGAYPKGFDVAHQIKRFPPFYQASDNPDPELPKKHSLAGLGFGYSWFKMENIDIEGVRQCFADTEVRIILKDKLHEHPHPRLVSMKVGESGFLRNQSFSFHEGLNSIIGGKGVGKSLAIEFLRFALGQPSKDKALFEDHLTKLDNRLEVNNTIEVLYQIEDGTQYQVTRTFLGKEKAGNGMRMRETVNCINLATGELFTGDIRILLPVLAYSQLEVIEIAKDKAAQLELLDRFIDTREKDRVILELRTQLRDNDLRLNKAIQAKNRLDSFSSQINTLKEQILAITRSLSDPLFETMKAAEKKHQALVDGDEFIEGMIETVNEWREEYVDATAPDSEGSDHEIKEQYAIAEKALKIVVDGLKAITPKLKEAQKESNAVFKQWKPEYEKIEKDYQALLKAIGGDREKKARQGKLLEDQLKTLERDTKEAQGLVGDLDNLLQARSLLLDRLEKAYREFYEIRKTKFDQITELSDQKLKLDLLHAEDRQTYEDRLSDLVRGGQNAPSVTDRHKIASGTAPRRLVDLVLNHNAVQLSNDAGISETWAERTIDKLWSAEDFTQVLAIQHDCYPADVPSIRYRKEGGVYAELSELSIGQKCTALLIVALCEGNMPVIIDQPEDALDIVSVWEDISKKLRRGKNGRQFILTTHNSSVAVSSDSDQFIVLDATANQGKIIHTGAIDRQEVRDQIIHHLEGGDEPYNLRTRKYNIKDTK